MSQMSGMSKTWTCAYLLNNHVLVCKAGNHFHWKEKRGYKDPSAPLVSFYVIYNEYRGFSECATLRSMVWIKKKYFKWARFAHPGSENTFCRWPWSPDFGREPQVFRPPERSGLQSGWQAYTTSSSLLFVKNYNEVWTPNCNAWSVSSYE